MATSPIAQYIVTDTTGDAYFETGFRRVVLELVNIVVIAIYLFYYKINLKTTGIYVKLFYLLLAYWNYIHLFNILFSLDAQRSLIFYLISVFGPSLMALQILNDERIKFDWKVIRNLFFNFAIYAYSIGLVFLVYRIAKEGFWSPESRGGGCIYFANFGIMLMGLIVPMLFSPIKVKGDAVWQDKAFSIGILLHQVAAVSRFGMIFYLLLLFGLRGNSLQNILKMIGGLIVGAVVLYYVVLFSSGLDMIDFITFRFMGYEGNMAARTQNDERFRIWQETIGHYIEHPQYWITGVGLSNYRLADEQHLTYSNAHNILINILFERGVLGFIGFLSFILLGVAAAKRTALIYANDLLKSHLTRCLKIGFLFFAFTAFFYDDLRNAAGQHTGLMGYFFFIWLALLIKPTLDKTINTAS